MPLATAPHAPNHPDVPFSPTPLSHLSPPRAPLGQACYVREWQPGRMHLALNVSMPSEATRTALAGLFGKDTVSRNIPHPTAPHCLRPHKPSHHILCVVWPLLCRPLPAAGRGSASSTPRNSART